MTPAALPSAGAVDDTEPAALIALLDALLAVTEEETALVRNGRLRDAAPLSERKNAMAGRYLAATLRLKTRPSLPAESRQQVVEGIERLRNALKVNAMVLATAHAVAENLLRGAAGELARKTVPQGYGPGGRSVTPRPGQARPLAVSTAI